ncbi:hypothetical protein N657DRAFT_126586 [Parathielavia appendiculata]|uniref:Uncharacterized protein n=1 Tax=Parathielavia appendiculata TaxID=2587402 RepID=A0AAN6TV68_9PEZI|nr:hypothetical protein N657DRAFT_126586 [Parathielavia appendiculata]
MCTPFPSLLSAYWRMTSATNWKHNDALHLLGPDWAFELLQINLAFEYLPRQDTSGLKQLNETSTEGGIQLLFHLANLKAEAALSARDVDLGMEGERKLLSFAPDDFQMGENGMAVWWAGKETVFIERHAYRSPDNHPKSRFCQSIRAYTLKLGSLLQLPVCVKHLHALELLGMVEFQRSEEIGFVLRLPGSLGKHRRGFPIEDILIRKSRSTLAHRNDEIDRLWVSGSTSPESWSRALRFCTPAGGSTGTSGRPSCFSSPKTTTPFHANVEALTLTNPSFSGTGFPGPTTFNYRTVTPIEGTKPLDGSWRPHPSPQ